MKIIKSGLIGLNILALLFVLAASLLQEAAPTKSDMTVGSATQPMAISKSEVIADLKIYPSF